MTTTILIAIALVFFVIVHLVYYKHIRSRKRRFDEMIRAHLNGIEDDSSRDLRRVSGQ